MILGEASYALYLIHVPLRQFFTRVIGWAWVDGTATGQFYFIAWSVVSMVLSVVVWKLYEIPARRFLLLLRDQIRGSTR